jgi:hypothetical protein
LERAVLATGVGFSTGAGPETPWGGGALSDVDLVRYLDLVDSVGATGIRLDAYSPTDARLERVVTLTHERGMTFLAVVWPSGMANLTPAAYAGQAVALAEKYAPLGVREWQLGNEPNLAGFYGAPVDPNGWRLRHNAAFDALKAYDPTLTVISAGLAPHGKYGDVSAGAMNQLTFLERALQSGPLRMDVFGYHGYEYWRGFSGPAMINRMGADPYSSFGQLYRQPVNALGLLALQGHHPEVELTEIGVPTTTRGHGTTEQAQADFLVRVVSWWEAQPWARGMWWYSVLDRPSFATSTEGHFGLWRSDWSAKPAVAVFAGCPDCPPLAEGRPPVLGSQRETVVFDVAPRRCACGRYVAQ